MFFLSFADPARVVFTPSVQYIPRGLKGIIRCETDANPPITYITWKKDSRLFDPFSNAGMMALLNGSLLFMFGFFPSNQKVQFLSQSWLSILESWPWVNSSWLQANAVNEVRFCNTKAPLLCYQYQSPSGISDLAPLLWILSIKKAFFTFHLFLAIIYYITLFKSKIEQKNILMIW